METDPLNTWRQFGVTSIVAARCFDAPMHTRLSRPHSIWSAAASRFCRDVTSAPILSDTQARHDEFSGGSDVRCHAAMRCLTHTPNKARCSTMTSPQCLFTCCGRVGHMSVLRGSASRPESRDGRWDQGRLYPESPTSQDTCTR